MTPIFTRYLYDGFQVRFSLQCAVLAKEREEALFWAYELYHSGFQQEVWDWVRELYSTYYEQYHPKLKKQIDRLFAQWKETEEVCLIGTVVGTLSVLERREDENKKFIIMYKNDRHQTKPVTYPPRKYLEQVSLYPIRIEDQESMREIREAYLGPNWLYYCADTPIWWSRIEEHGGQVRNGQIVFETDDELEAFYDKWGFEPDEQSRETHAKHGILIDE
jgi:hypothetical protein